MPVVRRAGGEGMSDQRSHRRWLKHVLTFEQGPPAHYQWQLKAKLLPVTAPQCIVYDPQGKPIARITVDPVTGERTREAL